MYSETEDVIRALAENAERGFDAGGRSGRRLAHRGRPSIDVGLLAARF